MSARLSLASRIELLQQQVLSLDSASRVSLKLSSHTMSSKVLDWLKPHRTEAVARLRTNGLSLVVVFIVTTLLPLPSPFTVLRLFLGSRYSDYDEFGGTWWRWLCLLGTSYACMQKRGVLTITRRVPMT